MLKYNLSIDKVHVDILLISINPDQLTLSSLVSSEQSSRYGTSFFCISLGSLLQNSHFSCM